MKNQKRIVVIGSINMDLVCRTPSMPRPGQTLLGRDFVTLPGGKGANQAVAAARLGGQVHMIGRVGDDVFGARLLRGLAQNKVRTEHVKVTRGVSSGCAVILVDDQGENSIVVVPGANHKLTPADVDAAKSLIARAAVVVLQLEIPLNTVRHAIGLCRKLGVYTILDPAPVPPTGLPAPLYKVDLLTPNETEAAQLTRSSPSPGTPGEGRGEGPSPARLLSCSTAPRAAGSLGEGFLSDESIGRDLLRRGARLAVLKLGARGAMIVGPDGPAQPVPGFKVKVVDSTAAGDAFTGALAVSLAQGEPLATAVRTANAAGALCCQTLGAQPSLPSRSQVLRLTAGKS